MRFKIIPIVDTMIDLYSKPRTIERFHEYISMLRNGNKGDMVLPIVGFNPMAKDHVVQKLHELKDIRVEKLKSESIKSINKSLAPENSKEVIPVVLNLADNLHAAWTNRYTTDYDSKFRIQAFVLGDFVLRISGQVTLFQIISFKTQRKNIHLGPSFARIIPNP